MEGCPITYESNVMQFCIIAIQAVARKMNIPASELTRRLEALGLIDADSLNFTKPSTLKIECKATPAIPDGFSINARIKVHAYGYDCNPGYELNCCGKCDDGCHVTFTLQDYCRSFNIGILTRQEVFVRMEYDLVDMQSGFHWTNKKVLRTKVMSKNNTIS